MVRKADSPRSHEGHEEGDWKAVALEGHLGAAVEEVARQIVDAGLKVHRELGPGLLESVYEHCLGYELEKRGFVVERQVALPVRYDGRELDAGYRLDMLVAGMIIIEVKSVEQLTPLHQAQLLTYLKLSGHRIGFLLNFNVALFKHGIKRFVL